METTIGIFVAALAAIFGIYKSIVDAVSTKSKRRREEFEFTEKFLVALYDKSMHPFIVEKGFFAIAGETVSLEEIKFLLSCRSPSLAIEKRSTASNTLEFNHDTSDYNWKSLYRFKVVQKLGAFIYLVGYIIFLPIAIAPFYDESSAIFGDFFITISGFAKWVIVIACVMIAIMCLHNRDKLINAKNFMRMIKTKLPPPETVEEVGIE